MAVDLACSGPLILVNKKKSSLYKKNEDAAPCLSSIPKSNIALCVKTCEVILFLKTQKKKTTK